MGEKYIFKLYVAGRTSRSQTAEKNLRAMCEQDLHGPYEIEVIDILDDIQVAEDNKIIATPTLAKEFPLPVRRIIGDLSKRQEVLVGLHLVDGQSQEYETEEEQV